MRWYAKLTVGKKILAGFLFVACVAGLSGIFSTGVIWDVTRRATLLYDTNLSSVRTLTDVVKGYQGSLAMLRDIIIDKSPQEQHDHLERLKQADNAVMKGLDALLRSNHSPQIAALHKQITEDLKLYGYFRDKIIDLATTDHRDEAVNILRNQAADVIDRIDGNITKIMSLNDAQALTRYTDNSATARTALSMNLLCLLLGVSTAIGLGWLLAVEITKPLRQLTTAVGSIAAGDLTPRTAVNCPADSSNEIHILSRNIDDMSTTLHAIITRITSDSVQLSKSSGKLNTTTASMVEHAEAAATSIHAVSTSSAEMNLTASEIARNCSTAAANVALATSGVVDSQQIMDETTKSMQRIGKHVGETANLIAQLGEKSIQINAITATIDDIADQTNLLALNAAIEAARAGDHGRGFAVVADEVRALAARTTTATKEISTMIQSIQAATHHAISAMNHGVTEAEQGTTMVTRTGKALQAIADTILTISAEVGQIATAAEEQSASIEGITANIQDVTTLICANANGTQEFTTAAAALGSMAEDLKELTSRFILVAMPEQAVVAPYTSEGSAYAMPGFAAA